MWVSKRDFEALKREVGYLRGTVEKLENARFDGEKMSFTRNHPIKWLWADPLTVPMRTVVYKILDHLGLEVVERPHSVALEPVNASKE